MSTYEQVLALIEQLSPEELDALREKLDEVEVQTLSNRKPLLGLHARAGKYWISPDFDEHLGDDFWLGDENDPLHS